MNMNSENFGSFLLEARKAKHLTQKELADKLFVSDKTISKWECGSGMPNIALLVPIAETLDVKVAELLQGKRTSSIEPTSNQSNIQQILITKKRKWICFCLLSIIITIIEFIWLWNTDQNFNEVKEHLLLMSGLMLAFGSWFSFLAKPLLPSYYDNNNVNFYSQGIFKIHMVGISFNNSNWIPICFVCKLFTLILAPCFPLLYMIISATLGYSVWVTYESYLLLVSMLLFLISFYITARKYA